MTFPGGDGASGYRFAKATADGLWGIHWPRTDEDFGSTAWEQRKAEKEQRDREIERQRLEKCLTAEQRDSEIRAVLNQLTLTDGDRRYLENRNVPAEVISRCRSLTQWQKLASPVHVNLPGVSKYGNSLNNPTDGILVAIPDHGGRLVAMRLHDPKAKEKGNGKKYSWLSSASRGVTPHLPNGENPIGVFWPNGKPTEKPSRIGLCEGMEWKAPDASNRLDFPVIGFSGYLFLKAPELLREAIAAINPDAELVLIPDGGAVTNPQISLSHRETLEKLTNPVTVAWWEQFTKADGDIDEIDGDRLIEFISPEQFLSYCPKAPKTTVEKLADWVKKQSERIKPKGFGAPKIEGKRFEGDRRFAWDEAIIRGAAFLDSTLMGSGKSHTVPEIINPHGGKVWYAYGDHRNPTVDAIARDFKDLYPRNSKGFYLDSQGKIKPANAENSATISQGNCTRAELFPLLTERGHNPNDGGGKNPICQTCPMANVCARTPGWYRADRRDTLKAHKIRCHIDSMPRDWDYSKDIILLDEPSQLLTPTKKIATGWDSLLVEEDKLRANLSPELWQELDAFLQALKPLFGAKGYGLSHSEIMEKLPVVSDELAAIAIGIHQDLTELFPQSEQDSETGANLEKLPPNALAHLLGGKAVIRIQNQNLTITIDRRHEYSFLNRAAAVGFLDASISGDRLQSISGLERPIEAIHNTPEKPLKNLTVNQIKVQGIGSKTLSNTALNRLRAVLKTFPDMPMIGLKAWSKVLDLDGVWWRDSRGTNDYAGCERLLAIGLPNPNLGAIQDDYLCLNGNLDGFEEHYAALVNEEVFQLIGRPRANRYPDRQFEITLITPENCDLSWLTAYGINVTTKTGFEVAPEAGNQTQATRYRIIEAILDGHHSQTAIAKALGLTQQAISKQLKQAGATVEKLAESLANLATTGPYKTYTRTSCITDWLYSEFAWFFGLDIVAIAEDAILTLKRDGWAGFLKYLENYPQSAQGRLLGVLYSLIDTNPPPTLIT